MGGRTSKNADPVKKVKNKEIKIEDTLPPPPPYNYDHNYKLKELVNNNNMSTDEWTIVCYKLIENGFWSEAKDIIYNKPINTSVHSESLFDLPTLVCRKAREFPRGSMEKQIRLKVIECCDSKNLNELFPSSGNNLLLNEIIKGNETGFIDLELIHYLISGGTDLKEKNKLGDDALTLAIKIKNRKLIRLILYHLNFKGTKQDQRITPSFIFETHFLVK